MIRIALSQRVEHITSYGERRDALDQRWATLLTAAGLQPVPIPNSLEQPQEWLEGLEIGGILLTGGNSLSEYGGDAAERDRLEDALIRWSISHRRPLLGVCRGMQMIQHFFGVTLHPISGHVSAEQRIVLSGGEPITVNSYHDWGSHETVEALEVTARAEDGVIKAIQHRQHALRGIMWHPERISPFHEQDLKLLRDFFGGGQ